MKKTAFMHPIQHFFNDIFESTLIAFLLFAIVHLFIAQSHKVRGESMSPTFLNDSYVLSEKISYLFHEPARGDVVVLQYPVNPDVDFIKRIIGLPGDTLLLQDGYLFINNERLDEPYLTPNLETAGKGQIKEGKLFIVPDGEYVVLGDNRKHSSDSRTWGTVPKDLLVGKAFMTYWPLNHLGITNSP